MALTIEGASIGFDANNLQKTLNHVHNNCVEHTKTVLRTNLDTLRTSLDACWVGQSAETFKNNMQHDVDKICEKLDIAYNALHSVFNKVQSDMAQLDENLVQSR